MVNGKPSFRCFILDMDGTIVETAYDNARIANQVLAHLGREPLPDDLVASYFGDGIPMLMTRCLGDPADPDLDTAVSLFLSMYEADPVESSRVYPGVLDTLLSIQTQGGRVGICTQTPEAIAKKVLDLLGFATVVDCVVGPESVTHRKPHPEPVLTVLARLSCDAAEAVFVGDMKTDMMAATGAGVATIAATYGYGTLEDLRAQNPRFEASTFADVLTLVGVG